MHLPNAHTRTHQERASRHLTKFTKPTTSPGAERTRAPSLARTPWRARASCPPLAVLFLRSVPTPSLGELLFAPASSPATLDPTEHARGSWPASTRRSHRGGKFGGNSPSPIALRLAAADAVDLARVVPVDAAAARFPPRLFLLAAPLRASPRPSLCTPTHRARRLATPTHAARGPLPASSPCHPLANGCRTFICNIRAKKRNETKRSGTEERGGGGERDGEWRWTRQSRERSKGRGGKKRETSARKRRMAGKPRT